MPVPSPRGGAGYRDEMPAFVLGAEAPSIDDVVAVARGGRPLEIDPAALDRVAAARAALERIADAEEPTYGVNTGFGHLSSVRIPRDDLDTLQVNIVRSHACGIGEPLADDSVRAMLFLLAGSLLRGYSGVRPEVPETIVALLRSGVLPLVPSRGSMGASGDLAPLAHCGLALMGEGRVRVGGEVRSADEALRGAGIEPLRLRAKEGLALLNGTHLMAGMGALAVADARRVLDAAVAAAALSVEALRGSHTPFDARISALRPHPGQVAVARRLREDLAGSEIAASHLVADPRVQDPYSMRCIPQVLGAVSDAIEHAARVLSIELGSVTDNPLVVAGDDGPRALSGGNFHGQPLSIVLDLLAIALAELVQFSDRRTYLLLSPGPAGLPPFLAADPGLESGLMILQYASASLVAELGVLATPAGPHTQPTSAGMEDFNSVGVTAALKLRQGLGLAYRALAIELVCGAQGFETHRPMRSGPGVERTFARVRSVVPTITGDRSTSEELERLADELAAGLLEG